MVAGALRQAEATANNATPHLATSTNHGRVAHNAVLHEEESLDDLIQQHKREKTFKYHSDKTA